MAEEVDLEPLNLLYPILRPYVKVLLTHEFGLLKDLPKIYNVQCGSIIRKNEIQYGDRFHLRLLYGKKPLNWLVIMNGRDITKAPDFIMEENFLANVAEETIKLKVPTLKNWQPDNINCLLNVVLELLKLYKNYQIKLLQINPCLQRYFFEYETLVTMTEIEHDDVEICIQSSNRTLVVLFLIHLNVDFSKLPTALPKGKNLTVLVIEFKDNTKNTIQLMPRVELEDALGGPLDIPDLSCNSSLMDYIPEIENVLQDKVESIVYFNHQRKLLYSYLVQLFEPAIINGDYINFRSISVLLEVNSFCCVLYINIPQNYPECQPTFQLLPFQFHKFTNSRASDYNEYPYNRNMTHEEIAKSIFLFVKKNAFLEFQKLSF